MIRFHCPRCNVLYELPDSQAGTKTRCSNPACNQKLLVPPPDPPAGGASVARTMMGRSAPFTAVPAAPSDRARAAPARPRPARAAKGSADGDRRGQLFERIGVGAFGVVVAVILVGLFMVLFPLMHPAASPAPVAATPAADHPKADADAGRDMKVEDVVALCKPSVALIKNHGGSGSGFLVDGGFVVTNSHVVADDTIAGVVVTFPSSEVKDEHYKVRLAYEDRKRDLAVLQIPKGPKLTPLRLCSGKILDGQPLVTIGSPGVDLAEGGLSVNAVAPGNLSKQDFRSEENGLIYLQYTAPTNPGNSGGPVLNLHGEVIGVHDAAMKKLDGVKLAIPVSDLEAILAKASSRDAAQTDHAMLIHDACSVAAKLEEAVGCYHEAALFCMRAATDAKKRGKDPGAAYVAVYRAIQAGQTELTNPIAYRQQMVDPQWADINDVVAASSLDDKIRAKLRQLRELYLNVKNLYESPTGSDDEVFERWATLLDDFPKLKETLDAEFGRVF